MSKCFGSSLALMGMVVLTSLSAIASGPVWEVGETKCMPNFRDGIPVGYLCVKVEPGSIYAKTGLQKGDNVTAINGRSLTGKIEDSIDLWKEFEKLDTATLSVERGDQKMTLTKQGRHS